MSGDNKSCRVAAQVISRPGSLGDVSYHALEIDIEGFNSPYVLTLAFPSVGARALAEQMEPLKVYEALAAGINGANISITISSTSG